MENTIADLNCDKELGDVGFRTKHNLKFRVMKYRCDNVLKLLEANGIKGTTIKFEERVGVVTVPNVTICTAVSIRNLIKYSKIYD